MAIKEKKGAAPEPEGSSARTPPQRVIRDDVNRRLDAFIEGNPKMMTHFENLVKEDPQWAVRTLMLSRMRKHEREMRMVERQLPQVKEWAENTPGMMERIMDRIKNVNPFYREKALVNEARRAKAWSEFEPPREGTRVSI